MLRGVVIARIEGINTPEKSFIWLLYFTNYIYNKNLCYSQLFSSTIEFYLKWAQWRRYDFVESLNTLKKYLTKVSYNEIIIFLCYLSPTVISSSRAYKYVWSLYRVPENYIRHMKIGILNCAAAYGREVSSLFLWHAWT